jgi:F-type H+-transporting ATPase subunit gamma
MANARALDKRRKSVRNIKKITRTMELIATARFKKAMDRATAATAYTQRITQLVKDLAAAGLKVSHPLLEPREEVKSSTLLVLTSNRGLCGGYNGSIVRLSLPRWKEVSNATEARLEISGKRGIGAFKFRGFEPDEEFIGFEDQPRFDDVAEIADRYLADFIAGRMDRLDVAYTRFESISRQTAVIETLLPLGGLVAEGEGEEPPSASRGESMYEFAPSAESILAEVVPASFRVRLFKCFLDAAVSEQIARMVAMKSATENADEMIRTLSLNYNRARQGQITGEIMEIIGGVEALES